MPAARSLSTGGGGDVTDMASRGVTRPMAMNAGEDAGHGAEEPGRRERLEMHHRQTLWVYWTLVLLGVWTALAPFTFGYGNESVWLTPSGGRGVWFGPGLHAELRAALMTWSDVVSGLLLVFFGWRSLKPDRPVSLWICCFIGIWLTLAPVILWSPTATAYLNDTMVGMLVIALAVLIPGMPNMILYMKMGPATPPGWSYNPSSWPQRWIMIAAGFIGFVVSRYLAAFQLGFIDAARDPFFGRGTELVLNSDMSHMWPVSDAALGTFAYTFEFLMGWMGAPTRWRTMPWMVTFFGILVIPLGLVHIALVISQPLIVGHWCTFCLLAAAIMLPMIPLEVDEVIAMGQHLRRSKERGTGLWHAFWKGGPAEGSRPDERTPPLHTLPDQPGTVLAASVWGMSVPWTLALSTALGIWLMAAPAVLGDTGASANAQRLGGSLIVTLSVIAMGEPVRILRYGNLPLAGVVALAPWVLGADTTTALAASVAGAAVFALALPRGPKRERYGGWDRFVR
ncbi:MAG: vitamin K epoxide reductase family protein [Gemmatimonadetes bacterium]|nr:vitamin K epoxide reductase family protein [Gemmatimonadota bacterium]